MTIWESDPVDPNKARRIKVLHDPQNILESVLSTGMGTSIPVTLDALRIQAQNESLEELITIAAVEAMDLR